jgi:subtilisin-like proprotein convertase family protein
MEKTFTNTTPVAINPSPPSTVVSNIDVQGLNNEVIEGVKVSLDIDHTWVGDLTISLLNPAGQRVILVNRRGGSSDNFRNVVFDASATTSIRNAVPPFQGSFRPEGNFADFRNRPAEGKWTLEVRDLADQDGGELRSWGLEIETKQLAEPPFKIELRFRGGLTSTQQDAFYTAAKRWSEIIVGDLPSVNLFGEVVDDVVIEASGKAIDGVGGILGQAGPTWLRPGSYLPAWGVMSFDTADLSVMEGDGSLVRVIMHEMAHVFGFGIIWQPEYLDLLHGGGTIDPTFGGANAMREFGVLQNGGPRRVPVENQGGPGTRDSHWREQVFGNELMTGWLNAGVNPISRLTIAALQDFGYQVNYNAADPYTLPSALMPALVGMNVPHADHGGRGIILPTDCAVLPEEALIDR